MLGTFTRIILYYYQSAFSLAPAGCFQPKPAEAKRKLQLGLLDSPKGIQYCWGINKNKLSRSPSLWAHHENYYLLGKQLSILGVPNLWV